MISREISKVFNKSIEELLEDLSNRYGWFLYTSLDKCTDTLHMCKYCATLHMEINKYGCVTFWFSNNGYIGDYSMELGYKEITLINALCYEFSEYLKDKDRTLIETITKMKEVLGIDDSCY